MSSALLGYTVAARVALGILIALNVPKPDPHALPLQVIDAGVTLFWGWALLRMAGRPERYLQMMTAIFGCELVLQPLLAPVAWFYATYATHPSLGAVAMLLVMALGLWTLVAVVRILKSATGWPTAVCVVLAVGQELLTMLVAVAMFPDLLPARPAA